MFSLNATGQQAQATLQLVPLLEVAFGIAPVGGQPPYLSRQPSRFRAERPLWW